MAREIEGGGTSRRRRPGQARQGLVDADGTPETGGIGE